MSIVLKRTPINEGSEIYLDVEDERALGMDDCGCGKKPHRSVIKFIYGSVHGLLVMFNHLEITGDCCFCAVQETQTGQWIPLTCEQYLAMRAGDSADGAM